MRLNDIFYTEENLRDIKVEHIECRETLCQINIDPATDDMFRRMMEIQTIIRQQDLSSQATSTMIRDEITQHYLLFILR